MPTAPKSHRPAGAPAKPRDVGSRQRPGGEMLHSSRWRKSRLIHLAANPLCVHCEAVGKATPANTVDHIKAHRGNPVLFWDQANWQSLCGSCHSKKTATEDHGFGN